jgi:hypothetical protein
MPLFAGQTHKIRNGINRPNVNGLQSWKPRQTNSEGRNTEQRYKIKILTVQFIAINFNYVLIDADDGVSRAVSFYACILGFSLD